MGLIADIGIYQDLNKVMPKQTLKTILPTFLDVFSINKKLLALPLTGWFCDLTYNADIFASSGLNHPNKQWTWEKDFYRTCLKLSKDANGDGIVDQWGIVGLPDNLYSSVIYSYGGSIVDKSFRKVTYTQKPAWNGIDFVRRLHTEKLAEIFNWKTYSETNQPFDNTKSAMRLDYDGSAQGMPTYKLPFKALSAPIPRGPKGSVPASFAMGVGLMVNSPNKPEAVEFIKYLYTITGQLTSYKATQCLPVTFDALKHKTVVKATNPDLLKSYSSSFATGFRKDFGELEQNMWDDVLSLCKGGISEAQVRERSLEYQERLLTNTPYSMYY